MIKQIPLVVGNQQLTVPIAGNSYKFKIIWRNSVYVMDINDSNNNPLIQGIPLVVGSDLLAQHKAELMPGITWGLFASNPSNVNQDMGYNDLGVSTFLLVYN